MKEIFVAVCVLVLCLGCAAKPPSALDDWSKFELVKIGMSKREVHKLHGKPKSTDLINENDKGGTDYYGPQPRSSPDFLATIWIVYSDDDIVQGTHFFGDDPSPMAHDGFVYCFTAKPR